MRKKLPLPVGVILMLFWALGQATSAQGEAGVGAPAASSPCGPSIPEQPIPDDGRWLQVCLLDPLAPEGTTVTHVHLKYLIEHPDLNQIEIRLRREDVGVEQIIWERGKAVLGGEFGKVSDIEAFRELPGPVSAPDIHFGKVSDIEAFRGAPSQGRWELWIRDAVPGQRGWLKGGGIVVDYEWSPLPGTSKDPSAHPGAIRLPPDAVPSQTPDRDPPKPEGRIAPLSTSGWIEIKRETFEGAFPNTGWTLIDSNSNDRKEYLWDDDDCRSHGGYWAAWPANGGRDGYDPCSRPYYPPNMASWMIYGPFDASDAKMVEVSFWLWRQMERNNDRIWFGFSNDGGNFYGWWWDGTAGWEEKHFDLSQYLAGDSSVWVGWLFESNDSVQYEGPWVDDILIRKYVAGEVTVRGTLFYYDRNNNRVPARFTKVYLYEQDPGGSDDLLGITVTDANGFFQFPTRPNWDEDDPDPNHRRLDLYVVWEADVQDSASARRRVTNFGDWAYQWRSRAVQINVQDGVADLSDEVELADPRRPAMWIFQDLRRAWGYIRDHTGMDPGSVTARWEEDQNTLLPCINSSCFYAGPGGPYIFIAHNSAVSGDTVVHEAAHHYMWNATGWWLWWDVGCYAHHPFSQEDVRCAWSEGWADFLPLVVNGDECFDFLSGPCMGTVNRDYFNLEMHSRNDDPQLFPWGDTVEGRVAGALYDLFDSANEGFDSATFGFAPIANVVFQAPHEDRFSAFWESWKASGRNRHHAVRAIWQNTIDYDTPPRFEPPLPDRTVLQGFSWPHAIDLWAYTMDNESADWEMSYQIVNVTDWRCGASLEGNRWINLAPVAGWLGSCDVTVRVSDSLKAADDTFRVNVVPVRARVFLPLVLRNSP